MDIIVDVQKKKSYMIKTDKVNIKRCLRLLEPTVYAI